MERSSKRKALIGGSGAALAGVLVGAVTLFAGGQGTAAHPGAVGAQRVDLTSPAASGATADPAQPAASDAPAAQPAHQPVPEPHHRFMELHVKNPNNFQVQACIPNSAVGQVCTKQLGSGASEVFDLVTINLNDESAKVVADIPRYGGNSNKHVELNLPVPLDQKTRYCVKFTETGSTKIRDMVKDLTNDKGGCFGY